jgi:hypothetical protein
VFGVLQVDLSSTTKRLIKDQRLWYMFKNFEDAEKCVLENQSDLFEYHYNMALIEEVHLLDFSNQNDKDETIFARKQWWYRITYYNHPTNDDIEIKPTIEQVDVPSIFENTCRFWVG